MSAPEMFMCVGAQHGEPGLLRLFLLDTTKGGYMEVVSNIIYLNKMCPIYTPHTYLCTHLQFKTTQGSGE